MFLSLTGILRYHPPLHPPRGQACTQERGRDDGRHLWTHWQVIGILNYLIFKIFCFTGAWSWRPLQNEIKKLFLNGKFDQDSSANENGVLCTLLYGGGHIGLLTRKDFLHIYKKEDSNIIVTGVFLKSIFIQWISFIPKQNESLISVVDIFDLIHLKVVRRILDGDVTSIDWNFPFTVIIFIWVIFLILKIIFLNK